MKYLWPIRGFDFMGRWRHANVHVFLWAYYVSGCLKCKAAIIMALVLAHDIPPDLLSILMFQEPRNVVVIVSASFVCFVFQQWSAWRNKLVDKGIRLSSRRSRVQFPLQ